MDKVFKIAEISSCWLTSWKQKLQVKFLRMVEHNIEVTLPNYGSHIKMKVPHQEQLHFMAIQICDKRHELEQQSDETEIRAIYKYYACAILDSMHEMLVDKP